MSWTKESLIAAAREAAAMAYAPYSGFHVGAALGFADGSVITGANVENASYGLTLCAETVAVSKALSEASRAAASLTSVARALQPRPRTTPWDRSALAQPLRTAPDGSVHMG